MIARVELAPITEALRTVKPYRPQPPVRRFSELANLISILCVLWILCLGIQTGWSWMLSNAKPYVPDPVLAAAKKAQMDYHDSIGEYYYYLTLPDSQTDGRTVCAHIKGLVNSMWDIPMEGNKDYDAYIVRHHVWVWAVPKEGAKVQWIDP
jgi:hypothetical protein